MADIEHFRQIWSVDFEYRQEAGGLPSPACLVAREMRSGRVIRLFGDELRALPEAPFPAGADTLVVAYYAAAEMSCFLELRWPIPTRVLDLYAEFPEPDEWQAGAQWE